MAGCAFLLSSQHPAVPQEMVITGVPTTAPFHALIMETEAFKAGDVDTGFIIKHADELEKPLPSKKVRVCCWEGMWGCGCVCIMAWPVASRPWNCNLVFGMLMYGEKNCTGALGSGCSRRTQLSCEANGAGSLWKTLH